VSVRFICFLFFSSRFFRATHEIAGNIRGYHVVGVDVKGLFNSLSFCFKEDDDVPYSMAYTTFPRSPCILRMLCCCRVSKEVLKMMYVYVFR